MMTPSAVEAFPPESRHPQTSPLPNPPAETSPPDATPQEASLLGDARPGLLLVVSAQSTSLTDGRWQFVMETTSGQPILEADDAEFGDLNRLTLLAAVRGLEAIDGQAAVTLLSHNRYLIRSLTDSLPRWRRSDFIWDHFGRRVEVQHADLWRRIDRTLSIHDVQACLITSRRISGHSPVAGAVATRGINPSGNPSGATHNSSPSGATHNSAGHDPVSHDSIDCRIDSGHASTPAPRGRARAESGRLRGWLLQSIETSSAPPAWSTASAVSP